MGTFSSVKKLKKYMIRETLGNRELGSSLSYIANSTAKTQFGTTLPLGLSSGKSPNGGTCLLGWIRAARTGINGNVVKTNIIRRK